MQPRDRLPWTRLPRFPEGVRDRLLDLVDAAAFALALAAVCLFLAALGVSR